MRHGNIEKYGVVLVFFSLAQAFLAVAGGKCGKQYLPESDVGFFVGLDKKQAEQVHGLIFHVPCGSKR